LNFREKFLAMAHFIYMMNVFRGLFGEHFKIQKADEVNLRKFILFILVNLIFDDSRNIILDTIPEIFVALLLNFD
jgi:hypothetical protein